MKKGELSLINSALDEFKIRKDAQRKKSRLEEEEEQKRLKDLMVMENKFSPVKQKFFNEILKWKNRFIKTDEFREIYDTKELSHLDIFDGRWGHETPYRRDFGCWSRLNLEQDGSLIYLAGYKWMGVRNRLDLERNIRTFSPIYIKELYEHIKSGEVYQHIANQIEKLSQFC